MYFIESSNFIKFGLDYSEVIELVAIIGHIFLISGSFVVRAGQ